MRLHALALSLAALAAPAAGAAPPTPGEAAVTQIAPAPAAPASPAAPPAAAAVAPPSQPSLQAQAAPAAAARGPSAAALEKLAQGDRAMAAGDHRAALFAYQDAVYMEPGSAGARVKLGRAYLALRYPAQAQAQAEQALALDPASAEARRLLDDAASPARGAAGSSPATAPAPAAAALAGPAPEAPPAAASAAAPARPRVYRLTSEPEPRLGPVAAEVPAQTAPAALQPKQPGPSAAQRYRAGVELIGRREYGGAVTALDEAIALDPRLGVAYAARASARFGLARYREAAQDYVVALELDPGLGTPLYGLAECYRLLGDPRAAELYRRYAESGAQDVREELRAVAARRAAELAGR